MLPFETVEVSDDQDLSEGHKQKGQVATVLVKQDKHVGAGPVTEDERQERREAAHDHCNTTTRHVCDC